MHELESCLPIFVQFFCAELQPNSDIDDQSTKATAINSQGPSRRSCKPSCLFGKQKYVQKKNLRMLYHHSIITGNASSVGRIWYSNRFNILDSPLFCLEPPTRSQPFPSGSTSNTGLSAQCLHGAVCDAPTGRYLDMQGTEARDTEASLQTKPIAHAATI